MEILKTLKCEIYNLLQKTKERKLMKLKFKNQEFQTDAVNAVINVFLTVKRTHRATFSIDSNEEQQKIFHTEYGVRNVLQIDNDTFNFKYAQSSEGKQTFYL